ncbi:related to NADPH-cytochrome P450 reductase (CprA) [Cephalotrichum gorgonifer]|uniref:NADPH--hemoprotein reductase n=1 Tax=Cephalotrichum gorgonifer TaxID=2041049 RepID=A0AAE8SVU1_9PEZI|nr:related to NADPH-cytochrome P450 reductase (CprA) [Cephalotrichum gorgonifer]
MPLELIQDLSRAWLAEQSKADHVLLLLLATTIISYNLWSRLFSKPPDIPLEFWYHVPQATGALTVSREKKAEARNIAHVFKERNLDIVILWGTQSGRAQLLARRLAKDLRDTFALRALAADLNDFDPARLSDLAPTQPVGFVLSTYGDGDPSDNTNALWTFLHAAAAQKDKDEYEKKKNGDSAAAEEVPDLSSLRYVLFGLGNSNYRLYNRVGTTVDSLLQRLGAVRFGPAGTGDDAGGETENDFVSWRREVQGALQMELGLTVQEPRYRPAFEVQHDASVASEGVYLGEPNASLLNCGGTRRRIADAKVPTAMPVTSARRLWETEGRLCLHMELDLGTDRFVKYKTGDHLAIWPSNPDHEVRRLLAAAGLLGRAHVPMFITPAGGDGDCEIPVPSPTTPDALFRYYLEITGRVSLETASALADFAPSPAALAGLKSVVADPDTFRTVVSAARLTLADLLEEVGRDDPWDTLPVSFLLERMGPMRPRYYSISSSAAVHPRTVSITAVADKPPITWEGAPTRGCYGLATGYLSALERAVTGAAAPDGAPEDGPSYALDGPRGLLSGGNLLASVRESPFKLPTKSTAPIIMVGAGTGVAPFRAFVQERVRRREVGQEVGRTLLFMGFRNEGVDFIYKEDWEAWRRTLGAEVFGYWTAFSREPGREKEYVQDLVRTHAEEVMRLLEETGCRFYICGSAGMARDVVCALGRMRAEVTGKSEEEAMEWVKRLRKFKTLLEDVWG